MAVMGVLLRQPVVRIEVLYEIEDEFGVLFTRRETENMTSVGAVVHSDLSSLVDDESPLQADLQTPCQPRFHAAATSILYMN